MERIAAVELTGDIVRILEAAGVLLASITALVQAMKARRVADRAQQTANDATDKAVQAAKQQVFFALRDRVNRGEIDAPKEGAP